MTTYTSPPAAASRLNPHRSRDVHRFARILVCLDASSASATCLPYAVALAKTFGSALTLLYVIEPPRDSCRKVSTDALGWELSRQEASFYLEKMGHAARDATGREVDTRLEQGDAAERITALAKEIGADLLVLGSQGEGKSTEWHLGGTVQRVLSVAGSSVLLARSRLGFPPRAWPTRILAPLDGSVRAESVLPTAARLAKSQHARLILAHVVTEPSPTPLLRAAGGLDLAKELATRLEVTARSYLDHMGEQLGREIGRVSTHVARHAGERHYLVEIAGREQVDLVVVSAHGGTCNAARPFGSVAAHLLAHSTVPLLLLQDLPATDVGHDAFDGERAPALRGSFPPGEA